MLLREWMMFSAAGIGLAKGRFTLHRADGAVTMSPLEGAGIAELPARCRLKRRIYQADRPARPLPARICDDARETARLSFEGSIGTFDGWRVLTVA